MKGGKYAANRFIFRNLLKEGRQLYVIFMLPALLLTIIFKYLPMGGILIAFEKYSPIKGLLHSEWVGFKNFNRFCLRQISCVIW